MKVNVERAIKMARNKESLKGVVIDDLADTQVRAVDALALAEQGILVPEQNVYYSDSDISYDPDFDEVEWSDEPLDMPWEEKVKLAEELDRDRLKAEEISVKIIVSDDTVRQWINENQDKMGQLLGDFIVDIYKASKMMKG